MSKGRFARPNNRRQDVEIPVAAQTKSTAPWSVKGIERAAREKAKDAARREGMTLGEWLNRVIDIAGDGETGLSALDTDAANDGEKLKDLAELVGRLSDHVAASEKSQVGQVEDISRKVGGVLERVQRLEQSAGRREQIDQALIRLAEADRARGQSIKALETAVTHVATQFNKAQKQTGERFAAAEKRFGDAAKLALASDAAGDGGAALGAALNDITERLDRVEKVAAAAGQGSASAASEALEGAEQRFRVLGDEIKRAGDRAGALEDSIVGLTAKIEDAEKRSALAVERVAEAIAVLRADILSAREQGDAARGDELEKNVAALAKATEDRIGALQASFQSVVDRLEETVFPGGDLSGLTSAGHAQANRLAGDRDEDLLPTPEGPDANAPVEAGGETAAETPFDADAYAGAADADDAHEPASDGERARDLADDGFDDEFEEDFAAEDAGADFLPEADDDDADEFADPFSDDIFDGGEQTGSEPEVDSGSTALAPRPGADVAVAGQSGVMVDEDDSGDIDDIMAELDALGFGEDEDDGEQAAIAAGPPRDPLDELRDDAPGASEPEPSPTTQPQLPPRAAAGELPPPAAPIADTGDDDASPSDDSSAGPSGRKRRLTPRQRAILQAKIRRKRLAEARARRGIGDDAAATADLTAAFGALDDADEDDAAPATQASADQRGTGPVSLFDRLRGLINRSDGAAAAETQDSDAGEIAAGSRSLTSRPVTLALGAGVLLTGATFVFLMQDGAIAPERNASLTVPTQQTAQDPTDAPADAAIVDVAEAARSEGATPAEEASFARVDEIDPAMQPRDLFVRGIEAFSLADGERQREDAIDLVKQAAALGHPPAQLHLGELYKVGQSVERDLNQARAWYRRAANGGHVLAMHRLGVMAARGEGGPSDVGQSIDWFEKAANYGLVNSMYNLGATFHPTGEADAAAIQDRGKSYYWYSIAARNGDDQAQALAEGVSAGLSEEEKSAIDARVAAWAAEPRDPAANERFDA